MGFTTAVNLRVAGSGERACPVLPVDDHAAAEAEEHQQARYYPEGALEPLILVRPEACVAGVAGIVVDGDMRPGCQVFTPAFLVLHGPAAGRPVPDRGVVVSGTAAGVGVANVVFGRGGHHADGGLVVGGEVVAVRQQGNAGSDAGCHKDRDDGCRQARMGHLGHESAHAPFLRGAAAPFRPHSPPMLPYRVDGISQARIMSPHDDPYGDERLQPATKDRDEQVTGDDGARRIPGNSPGAR